MDKFWSLKKKITGQIPPVIFCQLVHEIRALVYVETWGSSTFFQISDRALDLMVFLSRIPDPVRISHKTKFQNPQTNEKQLQANILNKVYHYL